MSSPGNCPQCGAPLVYNQATCPKCHAMVGYGSAGSSQAPTDYYVQTRYVDADPGDYRPRSNALFVWLGVGLVVVLLALGFAFFFGKVLGKNGGLRSAAKETEVKSGLHEIQVAVEKFAADKHGRYPQYLVGGEAAYSGQVNKDEAPYFFDAAQCADKGELTDPLLRNGYLAAYPKNPFAREGIDIALIQEESVDGKWGADPLKNSLEDCVKRGTRFGARCQLMGSVLADPRYPMFTPRTGMAGTWGEAQTWADIEYRYWDVWGNPTGEPYYYMSGQFFYKSAGTLKGKSASMSKERAVAPDSVDQYVLGGYGGPRTKGMDVLGKETQVSIGGAKVWPWTRSSRKPADRDGSPYMPSGSKEAGAHQLKAGNPNGVPDAIVMILTSDEAQ